MNLNLVSKMVIPLSIYYLNKSELLNYEYFLNESSGKNEESPHNVLFK